MVVSVLGSSSGGNATLVATPSTQILIDAGRGPRQVLKAMDSIGYDARELDAVLLSHEHGDHAGNAISIARQAGLCPIFATRWTQEAEWAATVKKPDFMETLQIGHELQVGDITITPFTIPHDAADPVGFRVSHQGVNAAVLLDCGTMTPLINQYLMDCAVVVIDSNYDEELLENGPYDQRVKDRVSSSLGHLSNRQVAEWITGLWDGQSHHIILGHLSRDHGNKPGNNTPVLARTAALKACDARGIRPNVITADANEPTTPLNL